MRPVAEFEAAILMGETFGFQCSGDEATLCIGIPKGRVRPALWLSSGGKTIMLAQFHGPTFAALAVKFLDIHSNAVQSVINHYSTGET